MKIKEVSVVKVVLCLILTFVLGIEFGNTMLRSYMNNKIPDVVFSPMFFSDSLSIQYSILNNDASVTAWIRVDTSDGLEAKNLKGNTEFVKAQVLCDVPMIRLHEIRMYDSQMNLVGVSTDFDDNYKTPASMLSAISVVGICSAAKNVDVSNKVFKEKDDPKSNT